MHGNITHHDNLYPCNHALSLLCFVGWEETGGCRGVAGAASATNWHSRAGSVREAHWPCRAHGDGGLPPRRGQQCAEVAHGTHLAAAVGNQVRHQMACLYMVVVIPSSTQLDAACHANRPVFAALAHEQDINVSVSIEAQPFDGPVQLSKGTLRRRKAAHFQHHPVVIPTVGRQVPIALWVVKRQTVERDNCWVAFF